MRKHLLNWSRTCAQVVVVMVSLWCKGEASLAIKLPKHLYRGTGRKEEKCISEPCPVSSVFSEVPELGELPGSLGGHGTRPNSPGDLDSWIT